jgi:DNA-binding MarR family transcriptional regulator
LVDRLERKGYVERKRDRRLCTIKLTDKGQQIYGTISQQFWTYVCHVFSSRTGDERVLLLGLLTRVRQSVEQTERLE